MDDLSFPTQKDFVKLNSSIQLNKFVDKYTKPDSANKKVTGAQNFEIPERGLGSVKFLKSIYLEPGKNCQLDLYANFPEDYFFKIF